MTQIELLNIIKKEIYEFPSNIQVFAKSPMVFFESSEQPNWIRLLVFSFLTEALLGAVYSIATLSFGGIVGSIVFDPIKVLVVVGLISFVVWLIFDKIGLNRIQFLSIYKILIYSELIVSIYITLPLVICVYLKSFYAFFILSLVSILAKAYFVLRGFDKQLQIETKKAMGIVGAFLLLFLAPLVSDFLDDYKDHQRTRVFEKNYESQTEDAIKEIEKDLGVSLDDK